MKGREHEHIAEGFAIFFGVLITASLFFKIPIISSFATFFGLYWFIWALFLFVLGSILPDSDSENMSSYIYFKNVFGISYLFKGLEYPIASFLKRKRGHRQSLHTISGISITSLVLIIILSIIAEYFNLFELKGAILGFVFLFLGQFLHLICDLQEDWKIRLS